MKQNINQNQLHICKRKLYEHQEMIIFTAPSIPSNAVSPDIMTV